MAKRCQVHFLSNIFQSIPRKSDTLRGKVKLIFKLTSIDEARKEKDRVLDQYTDDPRYAKACQTLDEGFEDAFQYLLVGPVNRGLRSENLLVRLNQEMRRRKKVIKIFPNTEVS